MTSERKPKVTVTRILRGTGTVPHNVVDRGAWWSADNPVIPNFWAIGATREQAVERLIQLGLEALGPSVRSH